MPGRAAAAGREKVRVSRVVGGAVEPLELLGLCQDNEVESLAESARWRVPCGLEHTPQDLVWYRSLLEAAHHAPAADEFAKFHGQIIFLEGLARRLGCKAAALAPPSSR